MHLAASLAATTVKNDGDRRRQQTAHRRAAKAPAGGSQAAVSARERQDLADQSGARQTRSLPQATTSAAPGDGGAAVALARRRVAATARANLSARERQSLVDSNAQVALDSVPRTAPEHRPAALMGNAQGAQTEEELRLEGLAAAAYAGDRAKLVALLRKKAQVNKTDKNARTTRAGAKARHGGLD